MITVIHCIVLAAGYSRRFEGDKLTYVVNGKEMYRHIVDRLLHIRDTKAVSVDVTVVTRPGRLPDCPIPPVWNECAAEGISSSIRTGLMALLDDDAPVAFFTADMPYLSEQTVIDFLRTYEEHPEGILCASDGIDDLNPVIFARKFETELMKLTGDCGGKKVARMHPDECRRFCVADPKELVDVDVKSH